MHPAVTVLVAETSKLVERAKESGDMVQSVTASEVFELVTALSWAVDRFGDDQASSRRRVEVGTAGIFVQERRHVRPNTLAVPPGAKG